MGLLSKNSSEVNKILCIFQILENVIAAHVGIDFCNLTSLAWFERTT